MGRKRIDLTDQDFGLWHVLRFAERRGGVWYWLCRCACGRKRPVARHFLKGGNSTACRRCSNDRRTVASTGLPASQHRALIRRLRAEGKTITAIAAEVGLSRQRVSKILAASPQEPTHA